MWSAGLRTGAHLTSGSTPRARCALVRAGKAPMRGSTRAGGDAAVGRRKGKLDPQEARRPKDKPERRPLDGEAAFAKGEAIRCYGTRGQLHEIRRRAATVGLSASAFVRAAALNLRVRPVYELEAARGLLAMEARLERIEAWLGRIAERGASDLVAGAALAEARQTLAAVRALADRA